VSDVVASATPPPPPPPRPVQTFDFARPFAFTFEDPEWVKKILLGGVFVLASFLIIGAFFVYGYLARLVRNVIAGAQHPLPEWDDLGEYFSEGLRIFAVGLVYFLPLTLLAMAVVFPAMFMQATDSEAFHDLGGMMVTCVWCLIFPISLALGIWMPGALLMVVVEQRFSAGFEFARIWNFIRANAGNYILAYVCWLIARFVVPFGFLLLCIGVVFTMFWSFVVGAYSFGQTYRLSRAR